MPKHLIALEVDASKGKKGANDFKVAINGIKAAVTALEKSSSSSFAKMDKGFEGASFKKFHKAVKEFNASKVSPAALTNVQNLAQTAKTFRAPTQAQSKNLTSFARALDKMRAPKGLSAIKSMMTAMAGFKPPTARQTSNLQNFVTALAGIKVPRNARAIASALDMITGSANRASTSLKGLRGSVSTLGMRKLSTETRRATKSMNGMGNAFSFAYQGSTILRNSLGALTLGAFARNIFEASNAVQTFNVTMETVSGSASSARTDLAFVRKTAKDLAIDLRTAQEQFASFAAASKVAGLASATTRDIFKSVSIAMTVLNRSTQDQELSFLALQQMISKGTVSSEELRRQLGERLPGALEIMARALGVSGKELNKMLKAGSILSKSALPKFAKELELIFGAGVPSALERTSAQLKLLRNDFEQVLLDMGEAGFMDALTQGVKDFREAIATPEFKDFISDIGAGLANALKVAGAGLTFLANNADLLKIALQSFVLLKTLRFVGSLGTKALESSKSMAIMGATTGATGKRFASITGRAATAASAMTVMKVGARSLFAALGPIGIAFVAIEGAVVAYDAITKDSSKSTEIYADIIDKLGKSAESAQVAIEDLSAGERALLQFDVDLVLPDIENKAKIAMENLSAAIEDQSGKLRFEDGVLIDTRGQYNQLVGDTREAMKSLGKEFATGAINADEFFLKLTGLAKFDPNVAGIMSALRDVATASIDADKALEGVKNQQKVLRDFQPAAAKAIEDTAKAIDESGEGYRGTAGKVKSYLETLRRGGATTKSYASNVDSLRKATMLYNKELVDKPIKAYKKSLENIDEIINRGKASFNSLTASLTTSETAVVSASTAFSIAQTKYGKGSREAAQAAANLSTAQEDQTKKQEKLTAITESLTAYEEDKKQVTTDLSKAEEDRSGTLVKLNKDTEALVRTTRQFAFDALSKIAPEMAKGIVETDRMSAAQKMLDEMVSGNVISSTQAADAMKEYAIKLETVSSAGDRAAVVLEEMQSKLGKVGRRRGLTGEELNVARAVDKFRKESDELQELLKQATEAGNTAAIEDVESKIAQFDRYMEDVSSQASVGYFQKFLVRSDSIAKANEKLNVLDKISLLTGTKRQALDMTQAEFNATLARSVELAKQEADPAGTNLKRIQDEIDLLTMSAAERRFAIAMKAEENRLLKDGIDLYADNNAELLKNTETLVRRKGALENGGGINSYIRGIDDLNTALGKVGTNFSENLTNAMADFIMTGKLGFADLTKSILADLAKIAAQQVFKSIFGAIAGSFTGGTGFMSALFGAGSEGGMSGSLPQTQRAPLSAFAGAPQYAEGTANTSKGIPSILHENEAVIPLSRNRKVPVEINGAAAGGKQTVINNYFDIDVEESGEVEDKIKTALTQTVPMIVEASRNAAMEDTAEMLQRRTI